MILVCPNCEKQTTLGYLIFLKPGQLGAPHFCEHCGTGWSITATFENRLETILQKEADAATLQELRRTMTRAGV